MPPTVTDVSESDDLETLIAKEELNAVCSTVVNKNEAADCTLWAELQSTYGLKAVVTLTAGEKRPCATSLATATE
jgi:hypothetical protein